MRVSKIYRRRDIRNVKLWKLSTLILGATIVVWLFASFDKVTIEQLSSDE